IFKRCGTLKYLGYCSFHFEEVFQLHDKMLKCINKNTIIEIGLTQSNKKILSKLRDKNIENVVFSFLNNYIDLDHIDL
ncbi:3836_t:CDS:1, partial [Dentiscutata heterogama]